MPISRERRGRGREQAVRIAVVDALRIAVGRQPHRRPVGADDGGDRLRHLAQQPDAVLDRAAIIVVAQVGAVAQELVDQIAVRGVDLDAVEPGRERVARRRRA